MRKLVWWLILGCLFAGTLYTYPELAPIIIGGGTLALLPRVLNQKVYWKAIVRGIMALIVIVVIIISPYFMGALVYFQTQLTHINKIANRCNSREIN